jgi:hypothetical protein
MTDDELARQLADWMAEVAPITTPEGLNEPAHQLASRRPAEPARSVRAGSPLPAMAVGAAVIIVAILAMRGSPAVGPPASATASMTATATGRPTGSSGGPSATMPSPLPVTRNDWTSVTWSLMDPAPFAGPGNQYIMGMVAVADGFVAAGYETGRGPTAIVWIGAAGEGWSRVGDPAGIFEDSIIDRVASVPDGLIAIGRPGTPDSAPGVRLWRSADGRAWTRVSLDPAMFGDWYDPGLEITSGPGGLIAFALDRDSRATRIWHSTDGSIWTPEPPAAPTFGGASVSIVGTPNGFIATGARSLGPSTDTGLGPDGVGVAFQSSDGLHWTPSVVDGAHGLGRVFVARDGLLAGGSGHGPTRAIVSPEYWQSTDGAHWARVADPGTAAARLGTRIAADGDRIYALSPYGSEWSTDGLTWRPLDGFVTDIDPRGRPWDAMYQFAAGAGGLVASGQTTLGASGKPDDQTDALIWQAVPGREPPDAAVMPTPAPEHDTPCPAAKQNPDGTCG